MTENTFTSSGKKTVGALITEKYGQKALSEIFWVSKAFEIKRDQMLSICSEIVYLINGDMATGHLLYDLSTAMLLSRKSEKCMVICSEDFFYSIVRKEVDRWILPKYSRTVL